MPLQGLFNCLVGIQRSPGAFRGPENRAATIKIVEKSSIICDQLSADKRIICSSEKHTDELRLCIVSWIQAIWNGAAMLSLADVRR